MWDYTILLQLLVPLSLLMQQILATATHMLLQEILYSRVQEVNPNQHLLEHP